MRRILYILAAILLAAGAVRVSQALELQATDDVTIGKLVPQLGSKTAAEREAAQSALINIGPPALPALKAAAGSDDPEVQTRATACIKAIRQAAMRRAPERSAETVVKELGAAPIRPASYNELIISPDGEHAAFVQPSEGKTVMVCDGKAGPAWDRVLPANFCREPAFASDGSLVYWATKGKKGYIVTVGQEDKAIELANEDSPFVARSPDGKHLAYVISRGKQRIVISDGQEGTPYHSVSEPFYLPGTQTVVYDAMPDAKSRVWVVGGKVWGPYEETLACNGYSPDGRHFAFAGQSKGQARLVTDGKEGPVFDSIRALVYSPDSKTLAYAASTGKGNDEKSSVIVNDKPVAEGKAVKTMAFSPDSRSLVWTTADGKVHLLDVATGKAAPVADIGREPTAPVFSPDGKDLYWTAPGGALHRLDVAAGKEVTVAARTGWDLHGMAFSPDSRHVAIVSGHSRETKWNVLVDGRQLGDTYDADRVRFWDGNTSSGHNMILDPPVFSADGRHVFFRGFKGSHGINTEHNKAMLVLDGVAWPEHDELWLVPSSKQPPENLRYIVRDGDKMRLMEIPWPTNLTWDIAAEPAGK
jgi:Tol biopolymer transport system component